MKPGIIVAMDKEYERLHETLGDSIILQKCGIGKVNAAVQAVEMIRSHKPDCIISTGVAGGLSPALRPLDVVVAREIAYHDVWCGLGGAYGQVLGFPERFRTDERLYRTASALEGETGQRLHGGLICSGDWFVSTLEEGERILGHFPDALAVDMESGSLAQVCHIYGIPFLSIRIISDAAGDDHEGDYERFWDTVSERSFRIIRRFVDLLDQA